jgi:hypothetical protein
MTRSMNSGKVSDAPTPIHFPQHFRQTVTAAAIVNLVERGSASTSATAAAVINLVEQGMLQKPRTLRHIIQR